MGTLANNSLDLSQGSMIDFLSWAPVPLCALRMAIRVFMERGMRGEGNEFEKLWRIRNRG
jgi:hypothetical protein